MDWNTPGYHQFLELAQTHVHQVSDAFQPSHLLSSPSPPAFSLSQHQDLFQWVGSLHQVAKVMELQLQHQSFQWILRVDFLNLSLMSYFCSGFHRLHCIWLSWSCLLTLLLTGTFSQAFWWPWQFWRVLNRYFSEHASFRIYLMISYNWTEVMFLARISQKRCSVFITSYQEEQDFDLLHFWWCSLCLSDLGNICQASSLRTYFFPL